LPNIQNQGLRCINVCNFNYLVLTVLEPATKTFRLKNAKLKTQSILTNFFRN
jgi:hypothetical protein